jgi:hypothetical protein
MPSLQWKTPTSPIHIDLRITLKEIKQANGNDKLSRYFACFAAAF